MPFYTAIGTNPRVYYGPYAPVGADGGTRTIVSGGGIIGQPFYKNAAGAWIRLHPNITYSDYQKITDIGWAINLTQIETVPWGIETFTKANESPIPTGTLDSIHNVGPINPTDYSITLVKNNVTDVYAAGDNVYILEDDRATTRVARKTGTVAERVGYANVSSATDTTVTIFCKVETYDFAFAREYDINLGYPYVFFGDYSYPIFMKLLFDGVPYQVVESASYTESFKRLYKYDLHNPTELYNSAAVSASSLATFAGVGIRTKIDGNDRYLLFTNHQIYNAIQFLNTNITTRIRITALPPSSAWTAPAPFSGDISRGLKWYDFVIAKREAVTLTSYKDHIYLFCFPTVVATVQNPAVTHAQQSADTNPMSWECDSLIPAMDELAPPSNSHIITFGVHDGTPESAGMPDETAIIAASSIVARTAPTSGNMEVDLNREVSLKLGNSLRSIYTTTSQTTHETGGYRPVGTAVAPTSLYTFHDHSNLQVFVDNSGGWPIQEAWIIGRMKNANDWGLSGIKKTCTYVSSGIFDVPTWDTDDMPIISLVPPTFRLNYIGFGWRAGFGIYIFSSRAARLQMDIPEFAISVSQGINFRSSYYVGRKIPSTEPQPLPWISTNIILLYTYAIDTAPTNTVTGTVTVTHQSVSDSLFRLTINIATKYTSATLIERDYQPPIHLIRLEDSSGFNNFNATSNYGNYIAFGGGANSINTLDLPKGFSYLVWIPQLDQKTYVTYPPAPPVLSNPYGTTLTWSNVGVDISYEVYRNSELVYAGENLTLTEFLSSGVYTYTVKSKNAMSTSVDSSPITVTY